eukprot:s448_g32.t1
MFDFDSTPWKLPQNRQSNGHDPFLLQPRSSHSFLGGGDAVGALASAAILPSTSLPSSGTLTSGFPPTICVDSTSGKPMDDVFFETYVEAHVLPGEAPVEDVRPRSRSRSKAIPVSERGGSLATTVQYTDGTGTAQDVESGVHDVESSEVEPLQELPEEEAVLHEEPQPSRPAQAQQPAQVQQPVQVQQQGQASQSGGDRRIQALQSLRSTSTRTSTTTTSCQLPVRSSSSPSSDNMFEVTDRDQVVEQRILRFDQREVDPPVVMYTNEEGERLPLDPLQSVLFYLEDQNGDRAFLEPHDGWKNRLPTPNHLRTIPEHH